MLADSWLSHNLELVWARQKNHRGTRYKGNGVQSRARPGFPLQDLTFNGQL